MWEPQQELKVVYRESLSMKPGVQIAIVGDGKIVSTHESMKDPGRIDIWFEHNPETRMTITEGARSFWVVGTGFVVPANTKHVGTVVTRSGMVFHIYKEKKRDA